jgi:hypothetical protein
MKALVKVVVYPLVGLVSLILLFAVFIGVAEILDRNNLGHHFIASNDAEEVQQRINAREMEAKQEEQQAEARAALRERLAWPQEVVIGDIPGRWPFKFHRVWIDCGHCYEKSGTSVEIMRSPNLKPERIYRTWNRIPQEWYQEDLLGQMVKRDENVEVTAQKYVQPFWQLGWDLCQSRKEGIQLEKPHRRVDMC